MHTLSEAVGHQAISCPAHCLLRQNDRLLERRGHPSAWARTMKREARQSNATGVVGHPKRHSENFKHLQLAGCLMQKKLKNESLGLSAVIASA